jgi:hypothetical protein
MSSKGGYYAIGYMEKSIKGELSSRITAFGFFNKGAAGAVKGR